MTKDGNDDYRLDGAPTLSSILSPYIKASRHPFPGLIIQTESVLVHTLGVDRQVLLGEEAKIANKLCLRTHVFIGGHRCCHNRRYYDYDFALTREGPCSLDKHIRIYPARIIASQDARLRTVRPGSTSSEMELL